MMLKFQNGASVTTGRMTLDRPSVVLLHVRFVGRCAEHPEKERGLLAVDGIQRVLRGQDICCW